MYLIFTSNTNLVTHFGGDIKCYKTCCHNLIFRKINFNIFHYHHHPLSFYRDIWDYRSADAEMMQKTIVDFHWKQAF